MIRPPQMTSRFLALKGGNYSALAEMSNFTSIGGKDRNADAIGTGLCTDSTLRLLGPSSAELPARSAPVLRHAVKQAHVEAPVRGGRYSPWASTFPCGRQPFGTLPICRRFMGL
jgi:hypothetical protein